ncbi:MAG TPA: hypothetical protein VE011_12455 [Candidatus Dormibacteraeota bacterium]|nr:hypothetical protein [Candidatus Dormibacteraeota bacterium]
MPLQGRSADDLPLAAYSTGVDPDTEPDPDLSSTTDDASAAAVSPAAVAHAGRPFGRPLGDDLPADPYGQAAPPHVAAPAAAAPMPFRELLRNPRGNVRDPRLVLSGVIAFGVILLGVSLLGGGAVQGQGTALASPTAASGPGTPVAPVGNASVEITGALTGTFDLTGVSGTGKPSGSSMASTWSDPAGDALALGGPVSAGTRATDAGFVLSWTVMVKGKAVTFTSSAGECVIGMAVKPATVSGSFTCHRVKSADGKLVVGATGTYRT